MKITILQGAFLPVPPNLGGAVEKMWFALGKEFAKRGHDVTHISRAFKHFPKEEVIDRVKHIRVKGFSTPLSGLYLKFLDFVYTLKAKSVIPIDSEVVVSNTFWAPVILNTTLVKRCFVDVQRMPKGQMKLYKKAGRLRANSHFVSQAIKKEIKESGWKSVVMIPNPLPFTTQEEVDFKKKKKILLYAGRIHPEKGLDLLLKAFKDVSTDWLLKVIGPFDIAAGGGGESYLTLLKSLSSGLNIEFTGPIYNIDILNECYREASIFVYPSLAEQGETFGLAPLEAMAWGCVPIVSNLSCFQDFITDNKNGVIFDHRAENAQNLLTQSISRLINNTNYTAELATSAIEVRESHSLTSIADHFLDEFSKLHSESNS